MKTVSLHPWPGHADLAVQGIEVSIHQEGENLAIAYRVQAPTALLRIPSAVAKPQRLDDLWQHSCFEIFLRTGATNYQEYNFSPSGDWAHYRFADIRQRLADDPTTLRPAIEIRSADTDFQLEVSIPLPKGTTALGLCAVIEAQDGGLSYWALQHPATMPDFHHFDAFSLRLE